MSILKQNIGLISLILGILLICMYVFSTQNSTISNWLIWSFLSVSNILPLLSLGIGLSLLDIRLAFASLAIFIGGFFIGIVFYSDIWLYFLVNATQHLYLTLPISSLFVGILLILPNNVQKYIILIISFIVSMMLGITIKLTDPTFHDPFILKLGLIIGFWLVISVMFIMRKYYRKWFIIPIRILASWLIASGILYGGTSLGVKYGIITSTKKEIKKEEIKKEQVPDIDIVPDFN